MKATRVQEVLDWLDTSKESEPRRKDLIDQLKKALEGHERLLQSVPIGIYRTTPRGRILFVNSFNLKMMRYPDLDAYLAVKSKDLYVNPEDRDRWQTLMDQEGVVLGFEAQVKRRDGTVIWIRDNATVSRDHDGNVLYYEGTWEDITAQKETEMNLKKQREEIKRLSNFPEQNPFPVVEVDAEGTPTYINPAGKEFCERLCGDGNDIERILLPGYKEAVKQSLRTGEDVPAQDVDVDGLTLHWIGHPIESLNVVHLYATDITQLKELHRSLSETDKMKQLLVDVITHDLMNPAGVIFGIVDTMLLERPDDEVARLLKQSSDDLLNVLNNVRALSRVASGEEIPKEKLDLSEMIRAVGKNCDLDIREAKMSLDYKLEGNLEVYANPIIEEIFRNYVSNAIKYAAGGKKVIIEGKGKKDAIVVAVKDFGKTIPEASRQDIFKRRFRLDDRIDKGQGLGLTIVKRIAEAHGATVWVEPNQPKGNIFFLEIPRGLPGN